MTNPVNDWRQNGQLFVWRYPKEKGFDGWHLTTGSAGAESLIHLLLAMRNHQDASRRTVKLAKVTEALWRVPIAAVPRRDTCDRLTVRFVPEMDDILLTEARDRLDLKLGGSRMKDFMAAIRAIPAGVGDYAIYPRAKKVAPPIWFWWNAHG